MILDTIGKGDVILARIRYEEDKTQSKIRPAVVVETHSGFLSVIALMVTSAPPRSDFDYQVLDWALAGLHKPSTVRTARSEELESKDVIKKLGTLSQSDFDKVYVLYKQLATMSISDKTTSYINPQPRIYQ